MPSFLSFYSAVIPYVYTHIERTRYIFTHVRVLLEVHVYALTVFYVLSFVARNVITKKKKIINIPLCPVAPEV